MPADSTALTLPQALQRALAACQRGDWGEARRVCNAILEAQAGQHDALHLLAMIAMERARALRSLGLHRDALDESLQAIELEPRSADAHLAHGIALADMGRDEEALESYSQAIALDPQRADAYYNRGLLLHKLERCGEALESYDRAIAIRPGLADAYTNRGVVRRDLGNDSGALDDYDRAIALDPASAQAHNNRGVVLRDLKRHEHALQSYDRAVALKPDFAEAHSNRGSVLVDLRRVPEALQCQDRAIALQPGFADAWTKRGVALRDLGQHGLAVESFRRALDIDPDREWLQGLWLHAKMRVCDWAGLEDDLDSLVRRVERGERATLPYPAIGWSSSPALLRRVAEIWAEARLHPARRLPDIPRRGRSGRLRIGYFSSDFREHAVSYLMTGVLEQHDRSSFEVTAFSHGLDTGGAIRTRVASAVERFVDVHERTDEDAARLARELGIDIAVDLNGYTEGARSGIFALRAAPIQMGYLGYPGTLGAAFYDYLIADAVVVPESQQRHYSESLVQLPGCYQANDTSRRIEETGSTRQEHGLPQAGFVFCCFNNNWKITPATFDMWMRVLARAEGSVLWVLKDSEEVERNLRKEAAIRGIEEHRLIFAGRVPLSQYLARYRLADLFLDTLPYNGHSTASDALWAGLPVLTLIGETFAGRVAASLLRHAGLPELVTETPAQYESLAVALATQPGLLEQFRSRLARTRETMALFDASRFARRMESAYTEMFARYEAGLPPGPILAKPGTDPGLTGDAQSMDP